MTATARWLFYLENQLLQQLKRMMTKPSAHTLALVELEETKRQLLQQQGAAEYHAKLAEYCKVKIARLNTYVTDLKQ
jgi:hypothetical protein